MIEILYEDDNIVFCVKPIGISSEEELPNLLITQLKSEIYTLHRLDTPVSGVMIYAKNKNYAGILGKKIAENTDFSKTYLVICEGAFDKYEGEMVDLLFKDSRANKSYVVKKERKGVKKAILSYKLIATTNYNQKILSLLYVTLKTGRSHQIRVQFASRKHPLAGDGKYGSKINCPIGLFSHKIEIDEKKFFKNPPKEKPWNLFEVF